MIQYIAIFIGGGLGSLCRFALSKYNITTTLLPTGTILANFLSCLVLGLITAFLAKNPTSSPEFKPLIAIGFCGGFSTFSTFSLETFELLRKGETLGALLNVSISLTLCLVALWLSFSLYRFFQ